MSAITAYAKGFSITEQLSVVDSTAASNTLSIRIEILHCSSSETTCPCSLKLFLSKLGMVLHETDLLALALAPSTRALNGGYRHSMSP